MKQEFVDIFENTCGRNCRCLKEQREIREIALSYWPATIDSANRFAQVHLLIPRRVIGPVREFSGAIWRGSHGMPMRSSMACALPIAQSFWASPQSNPDRKSTRLNSSHANISYAVFCLKK